MCQGCGARLLHGEEHDDIPGAQARKVGQEALVEGAEAAAAEGLDEAVQHAAVLALPVACAAPAAWSVLGKGNIDMVRAGATFLFALRTEVSSAAPLQSSDGPVQGLNGALSFAPM